MNKPLIALGVTGGIAAYKAAELCSMMVKSGYEVQVIVSENALKFVGELTFRTLSKRAVITTLFDTAECAPIHIQLANAAKLFVVAPASANFIAKYTWGIADDAITTFAAAFNGTTLLAPAMNPMMWSHQACVENVKILKKRGVNFIGPERGKVACGAEGIGRLAEVPDIMNAIVDILGNDAK